MSRIKIYPIATDSAGCFYQRLKMPLDALERAYPDEFEVCWHCEAKPGDGDSRSVVLGQRIMGHGAEPDPRWLELCRDPGIFAVYEIDDDILDLDPGNAVPYSLFMPNRLGTAGNIRAADHVIASTPNLGDKLHRYIREGLADRTTIAPNCVMDGSVVERESGLRDRPITVAWAGSMFHQQDFTPELVGQLAAVRDHFGDAVRWVSIGHNYFGWGSTFGWGPIETYHQRLNFVDIGIAPILRTPFNDQKSHVKALDYMAHGVVPVVEHWGQYIELMDATHSEAGTLDRYTGLTVRYGDWTETLSKAIVDLQAGFFNHHAIAERAREFEISKQVHRWADVFRLART